jgi:ABC-type transporter Mla maintaining outer membrane lipid asymmetry ATPase subunit MlaF
LVPEAENQILFDGTVGALRLSPEPRVQEFIRGDASRRIQFSAEIMDPGGSVGGDHP